MAAEDRGVTVRTLPFVPGEMTLSVDALTALLGPRTRLVALGHASNAVGTIPDLKPLIAAASASDAPFCSRRRARSRRRITW